MATEKVLIFWNEPSFKLKTTRSALLTEELRLLEYCTQRLKCATSAKIQWVNIAALHTRWRKCCVKYSELLLTSVMLSCGCLDSDKPQSILDKPLPVMHCLGHAHFHQSYDAVFWTQTRYIVVGTKYHNHIVKSVTNIRVLLCRPRPLLDLPNVWEKTKSGILWKWWTF